jgi:hypothetical protein
VAAASIERHITRCTSSFDRNKSWLMMPQPVSEASITRTPSRSMAAFSAAPTRVIPPASRPYSANARSFVEAMTVILPASGPMRLIADENTSMSISGAANTTAPILPVTVSP